MHHPLEVVSEVVAAEEELDLDSNLKPWWPLVHSQWDQELFEQLEVNQVEEEDSHLQLQLRIPPQRVYNLECQDLTEIQMRN